MDKAFARFDFFSIVDSEIRDQFVETYWSRFQWNVYPKPKLIEGVLDSLGLLKKSGVELAIVTSRAEPKKDVIDSISKIGLMDYISFVETRSSVSGEIESNSDWSDKTPQINKVCRALSIDRSRCMMAGDVPPDILSGKKERIGYNIALLSGGISKSTLSEANPDYLISSLAHLPEILSQQL